jgi:transposase-like protein
VTSFEIRSIETLAGSPDPLLRRLVDLAGFEEGARLYLERLRWPTGVECPRCSSTAVLRLQTRRKYHCASCTYQFRVTAGTRLHQSHVPGWKWLIAVELMLSAPERVTAAELQQALGGSFKTAWFLQHRIREALPAEFGERGSARSSRLRSRKYVRAYAAEAHWRSVRRHRAELFRATIEALLEAEPLSYLELTRSSEKRNT